MFNVLTDPWISARTGNTFSKYGILELFEKAHMIDEIVDGQATVECGLHRFVAVFAMDAIRPATEEDIEDLIERGSFDMDQIRKYVEMCEAEGVSFDLFDPVNPFMQEPPSNEMKRWPATKLELFSPENMVFADPKFSGQRGITPDEAARRLTTIPMFPEGGSGYGVCISRTYYFFTLRGKNLFETICLNMVPTEAREYGIPYWRMKKPVLIDKKDKNRFSANLLDGLTFPLRCVNLGEERPLIKEIGFDACLKYSDKAPLWIDPYAAYTQGKDGTISPIKNDSLPSPESWMTISAVLGSTSLAPAIMTSSGVDADVFRVVSYSLWNKQAKGLQMSRNEYIIPRDLLKDTRKKEDIEIAVESIKKYGKTLKKMFRQVQKLQDNNISGIETQYLNDFYDHCRAEFNLQIIHNVPDLSAWISDITKAAYRTYYRFEEGVCNDAASMEAIVKAKKELDRDNRQITKKGANNNG